MLTTELEQLNEAIKSAGSIIMNYFGNNKLKLTRKSVSSDYCTKADVESERAILDAIEKLFPSYNIFAEEHGKKDNGSEYTHRTSRCEVSCVCVSEVI